MVLLIDSSVRVSNHFYKDDFFRYIYIYIFLFGGTVGVWGILSLFSLILCRVRAYCELIRVCYLFSILSAMLKFNGKLEHSNKFTRTIYIYCSLTYISSPLCYCFLKQIILTIVAPRAITSLACIFKFRPAAVVAALSTETTMSMRISRIRVRKFLIFFTIACVVYRPRRK